MPEAANRPLLQQRPFRMLSLTRFSSRLAQNALNFALVLLIAEETGKALFSSLLVLALVVPATVAGIVAGTAADMLPKRLLVVLGDLARLGICVAFVRGPGNVASFYLVAIGLSIAMQFATAAEGAIMPAIVARGDLARANAISHAVGGGAQIVGFGVLTPLFLRLFGDANLLFLVAAGLFALAAFYAIGIGRVRPVTRAEVGGGGPEGPWWKTGWNVMRSDRRVMHAALELTLISAALIVMGGLIPKYIKETLGLPIDIGVLILMPAAVGVVLGLRVASFLAHRVSHVTLSSVGFLSFVVLLALVAFVQTEATFLGGFGMFAWLNGISIGSFDGGGALAMVLLMPLGFAYAVVAVAAQTVVNDCVPLQLQGRVQATQGAMSALASSVPVLLFGALSDAVGVTPVMALLAATIGVVAVMNLREPKVERPGEVGAPRESTR